MLFEHLLAAIQYCYCGMALQEEEKLSLQRISRNLHKQSFQIRDQPLLEQKKRFG